VTLLRRRNKGESVPFVHLLRHGAHGDVGRRLTGRLEDGGLTNEGRQQAERAARLLSDTPPSAIYASPRRRTLETAAILSQAFGVPVTKTDALDEIDFGDWAGQSFEDLDHDPRWHEWNRHRSTARCPGGETMVEAQGRALAFAFEVAARHEEPPLLVTHCDIIRALHCWSGRIKLDRIHDIDCPPGNLSSIEMAGEEVAA
jgi:broad specificity phosphatase PhoE